MLPSNHHNHNNSSSISNLLTKSCSKYFALDSKNFTSPPPLPLPPASTNKPTSLNEQKHLVPQSSTTITTNSNPNSSRIVSNFSNPVPVKLDSSATNQQQQQPVYVPSLPQHQLATSNYTSGTNNFIYSTNQSSCNQYMPYHHHETNMTPYYSQPDNHHLQYSTTNDVVYYKASPNNNNNSTSFAAAYFGNEASSMQCNDDNINNKAQSKVNKLETLTGSLPSSSSSCNTTYQDNSNSSLETDLGSLDNYVTNDPTTVNNVSSGGSATFGNIVMSNSSSDCYAYQNRQFIAQYSTSYHHQHHHHHHSNNQHNLPFDKSGYSLVNAVPSCENNIIF